MMHVFFQFVNVFCGDEAVDQVRRDIRTAVAGE
jgi:hypothetical protein